MWRRIRYDRTGRVRAWQPTLPRLAGFVAAAGLSFLVIQLALAPTRPVAELPASVERPAAAAQQPAPAPCDQDPPFVVIWGSYINGQYGYEADLPEDGFALTVSPPLPQHGCSIDLDDDRFETYAEVWRKKDPERQMWMYGSYNAAFVSSLDQHVDDWLDWKEEHALDLRVLARSRTQLDGLPAVRVTLEYEDRATRRRVVEVLVVAGRKDPLGQTVDDQGNRIDDIHYMVGLKTTPTHRVTDEYTFERLLRSWRQRAID